VSTTRARRALLPRLALGVFCLGPASGLASGCSRQPDSDEVFASAQPAAPDSRTAPERSEFELAPGSRIDFWLGPRARELHGSLAVAHSRLLVDPAQPSATRGSVTFDLTTLRLDPPTENSWRRPASNSTVPEPSLTEQSLRWLEVSPAAALAARPELRFAQFSIRDATAGGASPASRAEGEAQVSWTVSGELELHGVRAPYTLPLSLGFSFAAAAPGSARGPLQRLDILLRAPARVSLSAHALVPRDEHGDILAELLSELRQSRVDEVRLGARWSATPAGMDGVPRSR